MSNIIKTTDIQFVGGESRIDSRIVAKALDVQHKNFLALIDKYLDKFESRFGRVAFETHNVHVPIPNTDKFRIDEFRIALLTEDQAVTAANLSRNTELAVDVKFDLAEAFSKARKRIAELESQQFTRRSIPETIRRNMIQEVQVDNAKKANNYQFRRGGVEAVKRYNTAIEKALTGKTPKEWRELGKAMKLSSRTYQSGKAVIRIVAPAKACCISTADDLIKEGYGELQAINIAQAFEAGFSAMLAAGITPYELHH